MSRIYFHSPSGEAELRGSERAYASCLIADLFRSCLFLDKVSSDDHVRSYLALLGHPTSLVTQANWSLYDQARVMVTSASGENALILDGERVGVFDLHCNTALVVGSDPIKLLARLTGACELHTWVDGPNRAWLAGIIHRGISDGIYRSQYRSPGQPTSSSGWNDVYNFLLSSAVEPVVTSYSVCDAFPNLSAAREGGWTGTQSQWYKLEPQERWNLGITGIRESDLEMSPDNWDDFRFSSGKTAFDVNRCAQDHRLSTSTG